MTLKELMQKRRIDAARHDIVLKKWHPLFTHRYNDDGHQRVDVTANDVDATRVIWFVAWIDFDENVHRSTAIDIIDI